MKKELGTVSFEMAEDMNSHATLIIGDRKAKIHPAMVLMVTKAMMYEIDPNIEEFQYLGISLSKHAALDIPSDVRKQAVACMVEVLRHADQFKVMKSIGCTLDEYHHILQFEVGGVL